MANKAQLNQREYPKREYLKREKVRDAKYNPGPQKQALKDRAASTGQTK